MEVLKENNLKLKKDFLNMASKVESKTSFVGLIAEKKVLIPYLQSHYKVQFQMAGWGQLPLIFLRTHLKDRGTGRKTGNRGEKGRGQEGVFLEDRKQIRAGWKVSQAEKRGSGDGCSCCAE